jgi:dihydrodipicolinate synthase/N-acetylneuraminate lyase
MMDVTRSTDTQRFHGTVPPIVTPLSPDGEVDELSLQRLTCWLIAEEELLVAKIATGLGLLQRVAA